MDNRILVLFVVLGAVVALALMFFVLMLGNKESEGVIDRLPTATSTVEESPTVIPAEEREAEENPTYEAQLPPNERSEPAPMAECFVGGCSGQLCTDDPGAVSTCEYREEYMCYKTATCERQSSGQCGWTQSSELSSCLLKAQQSSYPQ